MTSNEFDISASLAWEEGLPRPQWDRIEAWIGSHSEPQSQRTAWEMVSRQWLAHLGAALGGYSIEESDQFLILAPDAWTTATLQEIASDCRDQLLSVLAEVVKFAAPGKQVVVGLRTAKDYYRYIAPFYPEGRHGGSGGVHVRQGYPHVVVYGRHPWILENVLAHELTHAALHHLSMPQWLEEGLAQMAQHEITGRQLLIVDAEIAGRHKRFWGKHGLDRFWSGEGFSRPGKIQQLCYQLAEVLVRLLFEDARPRWFGFVREPRRRLFKFLQTASRDDAGESACRECLGLELRELADRFLGPGS